MEIIGYITIVLGIQVTMSLENLNDVLKDEFNTEIVTINYKSDILIPVPVKLLKIKKTYSNQNKTLECLNRKSELNVLDRQFLTEQFDRNYWYIYITPKITFRRFFPYSVIGDTSRYTEDKLIKVIYESDRCKRCHLNIKGDY